MEKCIFYASKYKGWRRGRAALKLICNPAQCQVATNIITLGAGGGTLDIPTATNTLTINTNGISGVGGLTKTAAGTLALTAANTYQGDTTISGGQLTLSGAGSIASSPTITVKSGATLNVSGVTSGLNHDGTRFAL